MELFNFGKQLCREDVDNYRLHKLGAAVVLLSSPLDCPRTSPHAQIPRHVNGEQSQLQHYRKMQILKFEGISLIENCPMNTFW